MLQWRIQKKGLEVFEGKNFNFVWFENENALGYFHEFFFGGGAEILNPTLPLATYLPLVSRPTRSTLLATF